MRKCYAVAEFLSEDNKAQMRKTAEECGFSIEFFDTSEEGDGKVFDAEVFYGSAPNLLPQMPSLKWCHSAFAGAEHLIKTGKFDSGDVILTNSSGAYGLTIGEHIIMVSLMLMRQMPEYNKLMFKRGWMQELPIRSIAGSHVAIIGTGDIGKNTAARFRVMGASKLIGFNRSGRDVDIFDEVYKLENFDEIIPNEDIDILVLCVPGTSSSEGILNKERIDKLSAATYVVNVGRGSAIDQDALVAALNEGRLAGAALDVTEPEPLPENHPLWTARNCIITPHISGDMGLPYTVDKTVEFFCENLRRYTCGEELIKVVDVKEGY